MAAPTAEACGTGAARTSRPMISAVSCSSRAFRSASPPQAINEVLACGGLAERNALLLQLTADIIGREVLAAPVPHASAVGAAIYAATAAGVSLGGYADLRDAIRRMGSRERTAYRPRTSEQRLYESLYRDYLDLARHFGEGGTALMKRLRRLRAG